MSDSATELAALRAEVEKNNRLVLSLAHGVVAISVLLERVAASVEELALDNLMRADGHSSRERAIERAEKEVRLRPAKTGDPVN